MFSVLAAFALVAAFSLRADAQYMTQDVIFVKAGYIPVYTVTYDEKRLGMIRKEEVLLYRGNITLNLTDSG